MHPELQSKMSSGNPKQPPPLTPELELTILEKAHDVCTVTWVLRYLSGVLNPDVNRKRDEALIPAAVRGVLSEVPSWKVFCRLMSWNIHGYFPGTCLAGGPFSKETTVRLQELLFFGLVPLFYQARSFEAARDDPLAEQPTLISKRGAVEFLYPLVCRCSNSRCQYRKNGLFKLVHYLKKRQEIVVYVQWYHDLLLQDKNGRFPDEFGSWPPACMRPVDKGLPPAPWYSSEQQKKPYGEWVQTKSEGCHPAYEIPIVSSSCPARVIVVNPQMSFDILDLSPTTEVLTVLVEEIQRVPMTSVFDTPPISQQDPLLEGLSFINKDQPGSSGQQIVPQETAGQPQDQVVDPSLQPGPSGQQTLHQESPVQEPKDKEIEHAHEQIIQSLVASYPPTGPDGHQYLLQEPAGQARGQVDQTSQLLQASLSGQRTPRADDHGAASGHQTPRPPDSDVEMEVE